jgi:hypothetical protein
MADIDDIKQLQDEFKKLNEQVRAAKGQYFEDIPKTVNDLKSSIKFLSDELASLKTTFGDLSKIFKNTLDDLKGFDSTSSSINKSFRTLGGLADKLRYDSEGITDLNKKDLISLQTRAKIEVSNLKTQRQALDTQFKGKDLDEKRAEAIANDDKGLLRKLDQYNELIKIIDEEGNLIESNNNYIIEFNRLLDERLQKEKEYEKSVTGIAAGLLKGLGKIPIIGDMLDINGAQKSMRDAFDNKKSGLEQLTAGASTLGASLQAAMGPLALIMIAAKAIKALVEMMFVADKQITSLAKNLSISKNESQGIRDYFITISNTIDTTYNRLQDVIDAQLQLSQLSQFTILYSKTALENQIALTKELGLSEEEAAKLNKNFILNNAEGSKGRRIVYDQIAAFANQNKMVANGAKILQEVSRVSGQILLNFRGNLPALTNAVLEANKLGFSLEQSRDVSNSLLDFESSITNELEASVFLGRRFNLEQARSLALRKDYVGATQEVLKQVGSIEEFESMSAIHQQVIAKAAGMTVDQLSDSLMYQKFLGVESEKNLKRLLDAGQKDIVLRRAKGELSVEELDKSLRALDAQEKFNIAVDKAKEIFTNLVTGGTLDTLADVLKSIADSLASLTGQTAKVQQRKAATAQQDIIGNIKTAKPEDQANLIRQLFEQKQKSEEVIAAKPGEFKQDLFAVLSRIGSLGITSNLFGIQDKYASMSEAAENAQKDIEGINKQLEGMGSVGQDAIKGLQDLEDANRKAAAIRYGAGMNPTAFTNTPQQVKDGVSNTGPFTITDGYGKTAVTAVGDKLAVSPNVSINTPPLSLNIKPQQQPTLDLTPFINAFNEFKNDVVNAMSRPQPTPQFALHVDGRALGTAVGKQIETGTSQNIYTGYKMA